MEREEEGSMETKKRLCEEKREDVKRLTWGQFHLILK